jgi:hypothetical protein
MKSAHQLYPEFGGRFARGSGWRVVSAAKGKRELDRSSRTNLVLHPLLQSICNNLRTKRAHVLRALPSKETALARPLRTSTFSSSRRKRFRLAAVRFQLFSSRASVFVDPSDGRRNEDGDQGVAWIVGAWRAQIEARGARSGSSTERIVSGVSMSGRALPSCVPRDAEYLFEGKGCAAPATGDGSAGGG